MFELRIQANCFCAEVHPVLQHGADEKKLENGSAKLNSPRESHWVEGRR